MNIFISILILILGASIGSFLTVLIERISLHQSGIILGHSRCPHCKTRLQAMDLIPVISFLLLKGRCRYCKNTIAKHYPTIEIMTALVFLAFYLKFQFMVPTIFGNIESTVFDAKILLQFIIYATYGSFFMAIFFYDLRFSKIPDLFLLPFIAVSLVGALILSSNSILNILIATVISLVFFGGQILLSRGRWLGEGDLFLAISMSIILGWQLLITAIIVSYCLGALISIFLLLNKKVKAKSQVPFAPFLILGSLITIFFGQNLMAWYLGSLSLF